MNKNFDPKKVKWEYAQGEIRTLSDTINITVIESGPFCPDKESALKSRRYSTKPFENNPSIIIKKDIYHGGYELESEVPNWDNKKHMVLFRFKSTSVRKMPFELYIPVWDGPKKVRFEEPVFDNPLANLNFTNGACILSKGTVRPGENHGLPSNFSHPVVDNVMVCVGPFEDPHFAKKIFCQLLDVESTSAFATLSAEVRDLHRGKVEKREEIFFHISAGSWLAGNACLMSFPQAGDMLYIFYGQGFEAMAVNARATWEKYKELNFKSEIKD